jgi:hypothetical protein
MQRYTVCFIWKLIYMFRVVPPPIIRSANNCMYSIWYLSHRYYLPLRGQIIFQVFLVRILYMYIVTETLFLTPIPSVYHQRRPHHSPTPDTPQVAVVVVIRRITLIRTGLLMNRTDTNVHASLRPSVVQLKSLTALTITASLAHKGIYIIKNNL